jgi:hypothetical protein
VGLLALCGALSVGAIASLCDGASAGPPILFEDGLYRTLDVKVSPAVAGSRHRPQGVALELARMEGSLTGRPPDGVDQVHSEEYRLPRGLRLNLRAFPSCPRVVLQRVGPLGCPPGSVVGSGSMIVDARTILPDFVRTSSFPVINARVSDRVRALVLWAKFLGQSTVGVFELRPARKGFGPTLRQELSPVALPPGAPQIFVPAFDFTLQPRNARGQRTRVQLVEAPLRCNGSWLFQHVVTNYRGENIVTNDQVPCVPSGRRR